MPTWIPEFETVVIYLIDEAIIYPIDHSHHAATFISQNGCKTGTQNRLKAGLSYRNYHVNRADFAADKACVDPSIDASVWGKIFEAGYVVLGYTSVDKLMDTADAGLLKVCWFTQ